MSPPAVPENGPLKKSSSSEPTLVELYKELTGENETQARNVLMFVIGEDEKPTTGLRP
jgi:hypothetical protein